MSSSYWNTVLKGRISRRRAMLTTGAGALGAAFLAACGGSKGSSSLQLDDAAEAMKPGTVWQAKNDWKLKDETKEAVRGGIYRGFRAADLVSNLDPIQQTDALVPTARNTYQVLLGQSRGPGVEPGGTAYSSPVPALAESWEVAADASQVTFTLRKNVKFHNLAPVNGRVMDIEDWKASLDRHLAKGTYASFLGAVLDHAEYPDATHMVWKFNQPYSPVFERITELSFAFYIAPKELSADPSLAEKVQIGTGWQILDKNQPSITVEFRKHPEYWQGDPFIERWHQPIIPEYANQYAQFVAGHITEFIPTTKDILLINKDAPGAVIVANPLAETTLPRLRFGRQNPSAAPWKDPRVRIAIRKSIDYKSIGAFLANKEAFDAAGFPIELRSASHMLPNLAYWLDPEKGELGDASKNYLYDPAGAKQLAAAAGYNDPIELPYLLSGTGTLSDAEQLVTDALKKSGVFDLKIRAVTTAEYSRLRLSGDFPGIQQESSGGNGTTTDYFLRNDFYGKTVPTPPYPDAKLDSLIDASAREVDFNKRSSIYKDMQMYLAQNFFEIPGKHYTTTFTVRWPWLHNSSYGSTPLGSAGPGGMITGAAAPSLSGHLQWLDAAMPNRDKAI